MYTNVQYGTRQGDTMYTSGISYSSHSEHACSSKQRANKGEWEVSCSYIVYHESLVWHYLPFHRGLPLPIVSLPVMSVYAILGVYRFHAILCLFHTIFHIVYIKTLATILGIPRISLQVVSQAMPILFLPVFYL